MAKKRRNMQPAAKRNGSMQGFATSKHPHQACSLGCIAKLRFAFQPALQTIQSRQTSAAAGKLTSGVIRQQSFVSRHPFYRANLSLSSVNNLLPGSPGQHAPVFLLYRANISLPSANILLSGSSGQHSLAAHISIPGLTAFHKPVYSNSRQVKTCRLPIFSPFSLLFFCFFINIFI